MPNPHSMVPAIYWYSPSDASESSFKEVLGL